MILCSCEKSFFLKTFVRTHKFKKMFGYVMLVDTLFNILPWQECGITMIIPWYYHGTHDGKCSMVRVW